MIECIAQCLLLETQSRNTPTTKPDLSCNTVVVTSEPILKPINLEVPQSISFKEVIDRPKHLTSHEFNARIRIAYVDNTVFMRGDSKVDESTLRVHSHYLIQLSKLHKI